MRPWCSRDSIACLALWSAATGHIRGTHAAETYFDRNPDGSRFLWILEDHYHGQDFFKHFEFFTQPDPTRGRVRYVNASTAFEKKLAYVREDNVIILKADDTTDLAENVNRQSVRINTLKEYTTGLFILDVNESPWGCGVWPAWWSTYRGDGWPLNGEIDIIEGVHDSLQNQVAWHTSPAGCSIDTENKGFTGNITIKEGRGPATNCHSGVGGVGGCSITQASRSSFGPYFTEHGGGVIVMKWDQHGIAVWSFYRSAVPKDITLDQPNPSTWGPPAALLSSSKCDINKHFKNHTIIINITLCGEWGEPTYVAAGCPGTCAQRLMKGQNFVNATWNINYLKAYRKQRILATAYNPNTAAPRTAPLHWIAWVLALGALGFLV